MRLPVPTRTLLQHGQRLQHVVSANAIACPGHIEVVEHGRALR